MTKITFRADDDLVERLDGLDTSKSEAMREALRAYLDGAERGDEPSTAASSTVDDALAARVDELITARLADLLPAALDDEAAGRGRSPTEVSVNVTVDGVPAETGVNASEAAETGDSNARKTREQRPDDAGDGEERTCSQCGESVDGDHVYCPNCGEKTTHRVFCECGDELRSDWAFCPGCGRRTPAADVLERR